MPRSNWRASLLGMAFAFAPVTSAALPPVASSSYCGDQILLRLAEPDQIKALSRFAADRSVTLYPEAAARYPLIGGAAEELLRLGARIVLADSWGSGMTAALAARFGIKVMPLPNAADFEEIAANTIAIAVAIGREEQGRALVAEMRDRLAAVSAGAQQPQPVAVYWRPGGGSAGKGTFVDAAMAAGGWRNLATALGRDGWTDIDLETFLANRVDAVVTSFFDMDVRGEAALFGRHPVFRAAQQRLPTVVVPGRTWTCGAWFTVLAVERLAAERSRLFGQRR
ncbi:MAG: ABC transporter substrate-binding protein [Alphaproteobacteria bacterium]|nr:ABC transporter substrate-binding protein [Alphaproteobacteria bacterium]